jgi:hypothetical protein
MILGKEGLIGQCCVILPRICFSYERAIYIFNCASNNFSSRGLHDSSLPFLSMLVLFTSVYSTDKNLVFVSVLLRHCRTNATVNAFNTFKERHQALVVILIMLICTAPLSIYLKVMSKNDIYYNFGNESFITSIHTTVHLYPE